MLSHLRPNADEHQALLQAIGPLPLTGMAWPTWIKVLACFVLTIVGIQILRTAASPVGANVDMTVSLSIIVCFFGLVVLCRYMVVSVTRITEQGIEQTWLGNKQIAWEDLQFAKFIPLLASKRLICFPTRGRPIVFQAGTRELEAAFAQIALVYRRRT